MAASTSSSFAGDDDAALMTDINVTPLVDVILVLLIVFMITVPAIVGLAPIKVDLPESGSVEVAAETLTLLLSLHRDESGEVGLYLNDTRTDEDSLRALIAEMREPGVDQPASISADQDIAYGDVVKVLDMLASLGLTKVSLMTRHAP